jgi:hypothetical protein
MDKWSKKMKEFKDFYLNVDKNKALFDRVVNVAYELGYAWYCDKKHGSGKMSFEKYHSRLIHFDDSGCLFQTSDSVMSMSYKEFFSLTPEDVIVEPERSLCQFAMYCDKTFMKKINNELTDNQIERIKDIMNEDES